MSTLKLKLTEDQKKKLAEKVEETLNKGKRVENNNSNTYVDPSLRKQ